MVFDLMKRLEEGMEEMSQRKAFAPCASGINLRHRQEQDVRNASSTTHHVHQLVGNLLQEASERSVLSPS
jgi:hypothetical protein